MTTTKIGVTSTAPGETYTQPLVNSLEWNVPLNNNFDILNKAIGGIYSADASGGNVTLTADQSKNLLLSITGAIGANRIVYLPSGAAGLWVITNATTGAYSVSVYNTGGVAGVMVPQGTSLAIFSNGTGVYACDTSSVTQAGTLIAFAGTSAPPGYLLADGSSYATTAYPNLFAAIGTTWGGSGGNFNVPDFRGYFMRGAGTNGDGTVGPAVGGTQADTYLNHDHTASQPAHHHQVNDVPDTSVAVAAGTNYTLFANLAAGDTTDTTPTVTVDTSTTGGTETRPKNKGALICIKY